MTGKKTPPKLITKEEVLALKGNITFDDAQRAMEIAKAWPKSGYPDHDYYFMLAAVYVTGRIQGIREERLRNRTTPDRESDM